MFICDTLSYILVPHILFNYGKIFHLFLKLVYQNQFIHLEDFLRLGISQINLQDLLKAL